MTYKEICTKQTSKEMKQAVKDYLAENGKALRSVILSECIGKYSLDEISRKTGIEYTWLYKVLTPKTEKSFSFPLTKVSAFIDEYLGQSVQQFIYNEDEPIVLSILMSKVAECLMSFPTREVEIISKRVQDLLSTTKHDCFGLACDKDFLNLLKKRATIICQDLGVTYCYRNNHKHVTDTVKEMTQTFFAESSVTFPTVLYYAAKYGVPIDYLVADNYVKCNKIALRDGKIVEDEAVREAIGLIECLCDEDSTNVITEIFSKYIKQAAEM